MPGHVLSQALADIFRRSGVKDDAVDWATKKDLTDPMSFGLACSEERAVDTDLIPLMSGEGVKIDSILDKVGIRKAWTLCRSRMKSDESTGGTEGRTEERSLPHLAGPSLDAKWREFLSGERKLCETIQNKIFDQLTAEPLRLESFPPETLKLLGSIDSKKQQDLIIEAGKVRAETRSSDTIGAHHVLFVRVRAFWMTVSWCCSHNSDMFSLQDGLFMDDKMLSLIFQSFNGRLVRLPTT